MIFITGDTHGDFTQFSTDIFPEQKQMTKEDYVIVCGDFGLWHDKALLLLSAQNLSDILGDNIEA